MKDEVIEVMARGLCGEKWPMDAGRHRKRARKALAALHEAGFVVVPFDLLERVRDREYNPFEPDNQTKLYHEIAAMIAATEQGEG